MNDSLHHSPRPRAHVRSFGCRASQADGTAIEELLRQAGYETVPDPSLADLVVLNTCTVTHAADVDARRIIRGIHRDCPSAKIAVTGCYAQRAPAELAAMDGVNWVIGNSHKTQLAGIVRQNNEDFHGQILRSEFDRNTPFAAFPVREVREDRTRPNLKIQDGCGNRCSFCVIPSVRGPSRSAPAESVLNQVRDLAARYREIVLTGINLGRWGRDLPDGGRFASLLSQILSETSVARLRISSVEPMDWSDELIEVMAGNPRVAQHVHLPLQSGSDAVLKRMARRYRTRHYSARLMAAWKLMPDAAFGADVMTGFPGETDDEFSETVRFLENHPFTYLHVFTYSERPGTPAAGLSDSVPTRGRRIRTEILRALSARKTSDFEMRMAGRTLSAVTLEEAGMALSTNYLRIRLDAPRPSNQIVDVKLSNLVAQGLTEEASFAILA